MKRTTYLEANGMRLFTVNKPNGTTIGKYFANKTEAKAERDRLNERHNKPTFTVGRGPDHMGYHGNRNTHARMRRNRRS